MFVMLLSAGLPMVAIAQEHAGCWMVNAQGQVVDLNGSICRDREISQPIVPLAFSNLQVQANSNGSIEIQGTVTNQTQQPIPLVLLEYQLIDRQGDTPQLLYKGMLPMDTPGYIGASESLTFRRTLNARRLQNQAPESLQLAIAGYL